MTVFARRDTETDSRYSWYLHHAAGPQWPGQRQDARFGYGHLDRECAEAWARGHMFTVIPDPTPPPALA